MSEIESFIASSKSSVKVISFISSSLSSLVFVDFNAFAFSLALDLMGLKPLGHREKMTCRGFRLAWRHPQEVRLSSGSASVRPFWYLFRFLVEGTGKGLLKFLARCRLA